MAKEVRITFRSEVYIKGDSLEEIKEQWEELGLFSADALEENYADFVELMSVEDAETNEDLLDEFVKID